MRDLLYRLVGVACGAGLIGILCQQDVIPEEVRQRLGEVEKEQSYEELTVLRTIVMSRIKKERALAEVSASAKGLHDISVTSYAKHQW